MRQGVAEIKLSLAEKRAEFEELIKDPEIQGQLRGRALSLTKNRARAEDLVQETLTRAFEKLDQYKPDNMKAWVFRIMFNLFANEHHRIRRFENEVVPQIQAIHETDGQQSLEAIILRAIVSDRVQKILGLVPNEFRLAVILVDIFDFSYKETAAIQECPIGTIMSRVFRGRMLIREALRRMGNAEGSRDNGMMAEIA